MKSITKNNFSAFCIAGTHSGVGKTTITLGILAALKARGFNVQPFKCGPDYIDPGHHTLASGNISRNLDTWMMGTNAIKKSFSSAVQNADIAVVEGVMGLFDGASSTETTGSTAHVCSLLNIPVILVVNAKAMARSIAALVHGFSSFDSGLHIAGVIANNVNSKRHAAILHEALSAAELPPLLGTVPSSDAWHFGERHLGLITAKESGHNSKWFSRLAQGMEENIDIEKLLSLVNTTKPKYNTTTITHSNKARMGIAYDEAFQFYYEDNLDLLRDNGIELIPFSPVHDKEIPPDLAGLYLGGGYPELHAKELHENSSMRQSIKKFADNNGFIYAECGGLMYLCRSLSDQKNQLWNMCGVFNADTVMEKRRQRLGYVEVTTTQNSPFGATGTVIRGHEFHWSDIKSVDSSIKTFLNVKFARNNKIMARGLHQKNVWASYIHLHFASNPIAVNNLAKQLKENK